MIYYIQTLNGAKYVCAREEAKILIDENLITAEKFLEIIKENEVEIKHLQNVYDDLIYSVSQQTAKGFSLVSALKTVA